MDTNGKILIYYRYTHFERPQEICQQQRELCRSLGIKGRIIIAQEGINATLGGSDHAIELYIKTVQQHPLFNDIDYKMTEGCADDFPRLRVVVRDQIVHWGPLLDASDLSKAGVHLNPVQTHAMLSAEDNNIVVFDTRNTYESRVGAFKNALKASIENFRDLPEYIDNNIQLLKDKTVIMYCTSGVRCERASAYLTTKNVAKNVYQMKGGIQRYVEHYPEGYFRGKNYVFDKRRTLKVNDDMLSNCDLCEKSYDIYSDCINAYCNKQFIGCPQCLEEHHLSCGIQCATLVKSQKVPLRKLSVSQAHTTSAEGV